MSYDPYAHHRQSTRLPTWDYARGGAYFVTICVHVRACLFGEIVDGTMHLNDAGRIATDEWLRSAELRPWLSFDASILMPNHLHGIVLLHPPEEPTAHLANSPTGRPPRSDRSLGPFIRGYNGVVTARLNTAHVTPGQPVWQRNYYEHIIRNDDDMARIRAYIAANPARWAHDRETRETLCDP
jgi:REP element-mobilizing transposase RayT